MSDSIVLVSDKDAKKSVELKVGARFQTSFHPWSRFLIAETPRVNCDLCAFQEKGFKKSDKGAKELFRANELACERIVCACTMRKDRKNVVVLEAQK